MSGQFVVRQAKPEEAVTVFRTLSAVENWNPGLHDAVYFQMVYPDAFFIGQLDGEIVSCISAVRYNDLGFIGLYIVKPEYRKKGYGIKTFRHAKEKLEGLNIALDSVPFEIATYEKIGFTKHAFFLNRYHGIPNVAKYYQPNEYIVPLNSIDTKQIAEYEKSINGYYRPEIWEIWKNYKGSHGFAYIENGQLIGIGKIRPGVDTYKIGPLFAKTPAIAKELLTHLIHAIPAESLVQIDICSDNDDATKLAGDYLQLQLVVQSKKLWLHEPPNHDLGQLYSTLTPDFG